MYAELEEVLDLQDSDAQHDYYWSHVDDDEYCWKHYPNDYAEGCEAEQYRLMCEEQQEQEDEYWAAYCAEQEYRVQQAALLDEEEYDE